jgi:tetratricopeptide (TPR) repeat protein
MLIKILKKISCRSSLLCIIIFILCLPAYASKTIFPDKTGSFYYSYSISTKGWGDSAGEPTVQDYLEIAKKCKKTGDTFCEGAALYNIGTILFKNEYYDEAVPYYEKALRNFEAIDNSENIKLTLYNLITSLIDDYSLSQNSTPNALKEAELYTKRLLDISLSTDDKENEISAYYFKGLINVFTRNYYIALENYEKILSYYVKAGIVEGKGAILNNIAAIYYYVGDYKKALKYLQNAATVYMINDKYSKAKDINNNIGIIYAETGDSEEAKLILNGLEMKAAEEEDCILFNSIGVVYSELCEFEKALEYYNKSLTKAKSKHMEVEVAKNLKDIGRVCEKMGEYEKAMDYYRKSLSMSNNFNDYTNIMALNLSIGNIYAKEEIYSVALTHYELALKMAQELEDRKMEAYSLSNIGDIHLRMGKYKKSLDYYYKSFNLYRGLGIKNGQGLILVKISNVYNKLNNFKKGKKYAQDAINIFKDIHYYKQLKKAYISLADAYKGTKDFAHAKDFMVKASKYDITCGSREP